MNIAGTSAVVTGGASGLGFATATALAAAGSSVVILDLPQSAGTERAASIGATFAPADVTSAEQVQAAVDHATRLAPLRILVCCAGIGPAARVVGRNGPMPLEAFERVIQVNLVGTFNAIRLAAAAMCETEPVDGERGVIVTTSSVAAIDGQVGQAAYAASKSGIAGMTLPLARDLSGQLVRVMSIAPGTFRTPLLASLPQATQDSLASQVPHPARLGDPSEYAALVTHIIENQMLNGELIRLDGAIRMGPR